ncbi:DUF4179 domain-containing protein [Bacillus rubiinfantis]|uniref:DUF4179 domain-containing protein n=1 Tax=Bacillus rubiinfantis TaxID=1499680 RepID=UPI0005A6A7D5|nr:DUF4179 domain-containing protein [Bacillus rubiinfantis]
MDEKKLKEAIEKIEVPKEKVFQAMERGLKAAKKQSVSPVKKKAVFGSIAGAAVVALTLSSGFFNPSMNKVLAKTPFIGQIYKEFEDSRGVYLAKQNMVTELNEAITKNGVTVKLTSAYFDGTEISITGHVNGDLSKGHNEPGEVSFDVNYENYQGDRDPWLDGHSYGIREKGAGYDFQWSMTYPYEKIKENYKLPVTIHYINGIKGEWKFEIPIKQKNYETIVLNATKNYPAHGGRVKPREIIQASTSASLLVETILENKGDDIYFDKVVDNNGHVDRLGNGRVISEFRDIDGFHQKSRITMKKLDPKATALTFYPRLAITDPIAEQLLDKPSFLLKSKRSDFALKVNDIKQNGEQLIIDYNFIGYPDKVSKPKLDLLKDNLAYEFILVDRAFLKEIDPENPFLPENHSISKNEVKLLDAKSLHFQSVFDLNGPEKIENFKLESTVLRFDFNSLIESKELEPFTVEVVRTK